MPGRGPRRSEADGERSAAQVLAYAKVHGGHRFEEVWRGEVRRRIHVSCRAALRWRALAHRRPWQCRRSRAVR